MWSPIQSPKSKFKFRLIFTNFLNYTLKQIFVTHKNLLININMLD